MKLKCEKQKVGAYLHLPVKSREDARQTNRRKLFKYSINRKICQTI